MNELNVPCMKTDRGIFVGTFCTVFQVAFNDTAYIGKLHTYLVMAAGMRVHLQQPVVIRLSDKFIFQFAFQSTFCFRAYHSGHVFFFVLTEVVDEQVALLRWCRLHYGPVRLLYLPLLKHFIEPLQRLGSAGV